MPKPIVSAALAALLLAASTGAPAHAGAAKPAPAGPVLLSPAEADSLRAEVERNRAETLEWLKGGASSYLATVQRVDFGARTALTVGSGSDADVRIDDPSERSKRPSTVPVPNVFSPTTLPRSASWMAPDTISAELAVSPLARTTTGMSTASPPSSTSASLRSPLRSKAW